MKTRFLKAEGKSIGNNSLEMSSKNSKHIFFIVRGPLKVFNKIKTTEQSTMKEIPIKGFLEKENH